jgi:hypothetical protein
VDPEATDDVGKCALANTWASLHYGRPTLFLERELGEALLRTDLLDDLSTGDIRWRWPALRIVVPKELISIVRGGEARSITHFDVCQIDPQEPIWLPDDVATEIDRFVRRYDSRAC